MIIGTSIDIIEVESIAKAIYNCGEEFLKRIFNDEEIAIAHKRQFPIEHYAARFAAKDTIL